MKEFRKEPYTFMLQLAIFGSVIFFFFIFFVFVLKEIKNQSIAIEIPISFYFSTFAMVLSNLALSVANKFLRDEKFGNYRIFLTIGYFLGLAFIVLQMAGWQAMWANNVKINNNTSGSFLYILSGLYLVHTLAGLVAYSRLIADAFYNSSYVDSWIYSVNPSMQLRVKLITIYWQFLDLLWLMIFGFLVYQSYAL